MTWQPIDCHAHTRMSDGALTVEALIDTVRARGVRPSVSDHLSGDVHCAIKTLDAVGEYLDELERHDVARAGEFCWHDSLWRALPDDMVARFTHRLGSLHAVYLPGSTSPFSMFGGALPAELTPARYMDIHLEHVERLAHEMPVDIFAHPTLLPIPLRHLPAEELWTEQHEERLVSALARAGIAFEVSSRYRAHERIVRRAHERGVRLSFGSDGHTPEQVGEITFSRAMARAVGVAEEDVYDPFVHGSRTGGVGRASAPAPR